MCAASLAVNPDHDSNIVTIELQAAREGAAVEIQADTAP